MTAGTRWKYLVDTVKGNLWTGGVVSDARLQEELNQKALQGWEVVQVTPNGYSGWRAIYKKPA